MADRVPPDRGADTGGLAVHLRGVTKAYGNGVMALGPFDLDVRQGEFVSLLGPSGCGKSTALRLIAGLAAPTAGQVQVSCQVSCQVSRDAGNARADHAIGFVFQEPTLMPWTSVRENVRLPLKLAHVRPQEAEARVSEALARALVTDPDILLMDEPFAALDEITRFRLNDDLLTLWRSLGKTVIFVTHSVFESVYLSQRVVVMTQRPGRIGAEIRIEAGEPRSDGFRTSAVYADYCRKVSGALAPSYARRMAL